jgi:hypothetical protein
MKARSSTNAGKPDYIRKNSQAIELKPTGKTLPLLTPEELEALIAKRKAKGI